MSSRLSCWVKSGGNSEYPLPSANSVSRNNVAPEATQHRHVASKTEEDGLRRYDSNPPESTPNFHRLFTTSSTSGRVSADLAVRIRTARRIETHRLIFLSLFFFSLSATSKCYDHISNLTFVLRRTRPVRSIRVFGGRRDEKDQFRRNNL